MISWRPIDIRSHLLRHACVASFRGVLSPIGISTRPLTLQSSSLSVSPPSAYGRAGSRVGTNPAGKSAAWVTCVGNGQRGRFLRPPLWTSLVSLRHYPTWSVFIAIPRSGDHTDSFTLLRDPQNRKHVNCMGCWKGDRNNLFQGIEPWENQHQKIHCPSQGIEP